MNTKKVILSIPRPKTC